jgi:uncharacterized membrane protein
VATTDLEVPPSRTFPRAADILCGLGLGGFFDGIVFHQVLQWHHMLSNWYPVNTIENLEFNTRWDGIFHSTTYVFVLMGLFLLWRTAQGVISSGQQNSCPERCCSASAFSTPLKA